MREVGRNKHQRYWILALEAKYEGKGKEFGREEFDELLGDYAVSQNSLPPSILFRFVN
jgi:Sulfotransferase domain